MSESLAFDSYIRRPFEVEAIRITPENIEEVAVHVGTLQRTMNGTPYIVVDRNLVPNIARVYPGYYMTRMGNNTRCYSARIFEEQFVLRNVEVDAGWKLITENSDK